jgi:Domain of unknown function (DUF4432)
MAPVQRTPAQLAAAGQLANLDQLATITASTVAGGPAHGCRAIDLRVAGGIDLRLLPDRGLDLGAAWYRGTPLAWISAVGEHGPLDAPRDLDWVDAFGGGLVVTCGLRNVGSPSEGHGQHGRYSHLRASQVTTGRSFDDDGQIVLEAAAVVDEVGALGPHLRVERSVRTWTGTGRAELTDRTTNLGDRPEPAPLLYHVNLGPPLLDEDAQVWVDSERVLPRDADAAAGIARWAAPGKPEPGAGELVFEHELAAGDEGWCRAALVNPALGLEFELSWEREELPRFHQWLHPAAGIYVLGLEPANCSVLGRAADRAAGRLPILEPGATRTTRLRVHCGPAEG